MMASGSPSLPKLAKTQHISIFTYSTISYFNIVTNFAMISMRRHRAITWDGEPAAMFDKIQAAYLLIIFLSLFKRIKAESKKLASRRAWVCS